MAAVSSKAAAAYLIDPLTAPQPSDETGLNSHFVAPKESTPSSPRTVASNNPYRRSLEASIGHSRHRSGGSGDRKSPTISEHAINSKEGSPVDDAFAAGHRRRSSSLRARFPGDESHKPLDLLRKDSKRAQRSPHLTKRQLAGPDTIDRLDHATVGRSYHHEGPYDATLASRNRDEKTAPLAALKATNEEALKATPIENVKDSIERHKPLDGTAFVPPGEYDRFGRKYEYEPGENMMIDLNPGGGQYKRYAGLKYHPDDIKGKGEPSYSQDIAEKSRHAQHEDHRGDIEMTDHSHSKESSGRARSGSLKEGLKRRIGSLRRKDHNE